MAIKYVDTVKYFLSFYSANSPPSYLVLLSRQGKVVRICK